MYQTETRPDMLSVLSTVIGHIAKMDTPLDQLLHGPGSRKIFEFSDWAATGDASSRWQKLYSDTIKPMSQRDLQFIFHLGDVAGRKVFEVDEVLDIIGDFSHYGLVTLILDTHEADTLWCRLNGQNRDAVLSGDGATTAQERYRFLFNTMRTDSLVILEGLRARQVSRDGQIQLTGPSAISVLGMINARTRFSIGYQLGLLLELGALSGVVLGLAVSATCTNPLSSPNAAALLAYLNNWQNIVKN